MSIQYQGLRFHKLFQCLYNYVDYIYFSAKDILQLRIIFRLADAQQPTVDLQGNYFRSVMELKWQDVQTN